MSPFCELGLRANMRLGSKGLGKQPDREFDRISGRDPFQVAPATAKGIRVVPMLREGSPRRALSYFWVRGTRVTRWDGWRIKARTRRGRPVRDPRDAEYAIEFAERELA